MEKFVGFILAEWGSLSNNYEKYRIEITEKMQKLRKILGKHQY